MQVKGIHRNMNTRRRGLSWTITGSAYYKKKKTSKESLAAAFYNLKKKVLTAGVVETTGHDTAHVSPNRLSRVQHGLTYKENQIISNFIN